MTAPTRSAVDPAASPVAGVLAKARHENFSVAPRFLPVTLRRDLMAVYGFARLVDDLGDEGNHSAAERQRLLDGIDADLDVLYAGGTPGQPLLRALVPTVAAHGLPVEPFRRLVQANRVDQRVTRYPTFDDLVGYCALSANPVGRLVLGIFDASTPEREAWSDDVCTALQLAEHWQDVAEDYTRGRIYLPVEDLDRFRVREGELAAAPTSDRLRRLLAFEVRRARQWLDSGAPLVASLTGLSRVAVAGFVAGGRAALDAITASDFDVVTATRRAAKARVAGETLRVLAGASTAPWRRR